jgi:hypothetical protein
MKESDDWQFEEEENTEEIERTGQNSGSVVPSFGPPALR